MTDKPITFDAPVLEAIRANRKTQFRTIFKLPEKQFEHPQMNGWEPTTSQLPIPKGRGL